ncbi:MULTISPECIES: suppressor of fused domain protein [Acinetobacter]|uniref:suppressor of fused domain protein n=1 Tax=Acinetobacter TaxID=469 RepID=UPI0002CFE308|nr:MULTISPECIES: suppressor of fused domain protein [Acinetobacter]ENX63765.1 hypothetical protein F885_00509 [Acinetobacter higginsii]MCH7294507.1 suppressor of fused domain protein [Acinetobacter higginsii]MCH7317294.1 suppressor of fused domain protein [Acinetobacter higginsii]MCH7338297.1 suppressor of fused domain protein [Acinetobacter higginsii]MDO3666852.1 suppressor of fused domain protein [Acinetobacter higginsii]
MKFDSKESLILDIYRSQILSLYIREWGQPENRWIFKKENDIPLEIYFFPRKDNDSISRIVTIGIGLISQFKKQKFNFEYLFALPYDFVEKNEEMIVKYLLDIALHLSKSEAESDIRVISEINVAPNCFLQKSILVDEARGEAEELADIFIAEKFNNVALRWVIPVYKDEADFILKNGIEEFDCLESSSNLSLVDINRNSFLDTLIN